MEDPVKLKHVGKVVQRTKPLEPIALGVLDGHILPEPWRRVGDHQPLQETDLLPAFEHGLGEHAVCGGAVNSRQVSKDYRAIFCAACHMRHAVPITVVSWGGLREYFKQLFAH